MRILHVYSHDNPRLAMYVSLLSQAMQADVECVFADNASDMRLAVRDFRPDIIHQHGRFPVSGADTRVSPPPRLVVSPHGETVDFRQAYAVIARSPYELTAIKAERKELVSNPLITRTITFDEASDAIRVIYCRVLDSHPLELMDTATRRLFAVLLKAGLLGDKGWVSDSSPVTHRISLYDFHHLFIYAELEGVLHIVQRGIDILGLSDAETNSSHSILHPSSVNIDCYLPHGYTKSEAMAGASITKMLHDIAKNGVTLLRLTELTKALYDDNLDEDALMRQVEEDKQRPLLQSLLQLLSEQTLLTEGFMPCPPIDSSDTQRLRSQLENHLKL